MLLSDTQVLIAAVVAGVCTLATFSILGVSLARGQSPLARLSGPVAAVLLGLVLLLAVALIWLGAVVGGVALLLAVTSLAVTRQLAARSR